MEDVRGWRVIDNDGVFEVASNLGKILDVVSLVVIAALSEQTMVDYFVDIKLIQQRITIL